MVFTQSSEESTSGVMMTYGPSWRITSKTNTADPQFYIHLETQLKKETTEAEKPTVCHFYGGPKKGMI